MLLRLKSDLHVLKLSKASNTDEGGTADCDALVQEQIVHTVELIVALEVQLASDLLV